MDPQKLTDEELVRLLLATQDKALREELWFEFWRRFHPVIAGVIVKKLIRRPRWVDHSVVDDLVSETFLKICKDDFKVLRNFEFRHENALRAFLKVVAAHVVEDYFRNLNGDEEELDFDSARDRSDFLDVIDRRMKLQKIENCLQQLSGEPNFARDCKIFRLYFRDGFTAQGISELPEIGLSVKGVESTLLRLVKRIRNCLELQGFPFRPSTP